MEKEKWTLQNMPDLTGKVIIVTGGNSGLGYSSVAAFASKGAEVILACRSLERGEAAKNEIITNHKGAKLKVMQLDLMDLKSVNLFVTNFKQEYTKLDVLLNNAGIMSVPYGLTADGFEKQLGTNHLGHFALTELLMDIISKTPRSRVVNVSSIAHKSGEMDYNNLQFENGNGYTPMKAYSKSKLANLLFTYELQRYFEANKIDSIAVAAHPGVSNTHLGDHMKNKFIYKLVVPLINALIQKPEIGSLAQIRAAVDDKVSGSDYYGAKGLFEMWGYPVIVKSAASSHNKESAKKLWQESEKLTGVNYMNY
jgi:NAD(P)-dependent dehydrogenase (short-subunit alcohol dehydrogenase family)